MWPRNAAVACRRSRTCKRAKENITGLTQPMGLSPTTRSDATPTECCFFPIAPKKLLLRPLHCPLAGVYCGFVRQIPKSSFLCSLRRPVGITHGG